MMAVAELHVAPSAAKSSLEIAEYTKRDLEALLRDESFWMQPRLPITKRRVVSQVANPRADDNDTLLLTAHFKGQLVACLGVLPDQVKDPSQGRVKFGWLTAWWADKESEQRLAAMKLLFMAMKRYANRLAASSPASAAASAYLNTGQFEEHGRCDRTYFIISMSPSTGLPGRVVRSVAGVKNRWLYGRSAVRRELRVHIPDVFDAQMESFINHHARKIRSVTTVFTGTGLCGFPGCRPRTKTGSCRKNTLFRCSPGDFPANSHVRESPRQDRSRFSS